MKKQAEASAVVSISFFKRFLIFFGVVRWLTREEASYLFKNARHPVPLGIEGWVKAKIWVYMFTPNWEKVFYHWLSLVNEEKLVKDCFFSAAKSTFWPKKEHPLRNAAGKKWLTFLTNWRSSYHHEMVWKLSSYSNIWIEPDTEGHQAAVERRTEFAWEMIRNARTRAELFAAEDYAPEGSDAKAFVRQLLSQKAVA